MPVRVLTTDPFPSMKNQIGAMISLEGRGFQRRPVRGSIKSGGWSTERERKSIRLPRTEPYPLRRGGSPPRPRSTSQTAIREAFLSPTTDHLPKLPPLTGRYTARSSCFTAARQRVPALRLRSMGRGLAHESGEGRCFCTEGRKLILLSSLYHGPTSRQDTALS
jgi:hypothetical protein